MPHSLFPSQVPKTHKTYTVSHAYLLKQFKSSCSRYILFAGFRMLEMCIRLKIAHRNLKVLLLKERQNNMQSFCLISIEEVVSILWYIVRPRQRSSPQTKKDREAKLHYLHDSTKPPKCHFRRLNRGPCGTISILIFSLRKALGLEIPYPFRTCRNSVWFGTYEFFKFAKSGLNFFLSSSSSFFFPTLQFVGLLTNF